METGLILLMFALLAFGWLAMLYLIKYYTIQEAQKMKIPLIIEERDSYDKLFEGIHAANNALIEADVPVPEKALIAENIAKKTLVKYSQYQISAMITILSDPARRIVENVISGMKDGKVNFGDIPEGIAIVSALSEIAKRLPEAGTEIENLNYDEVEIMLLVLMRFAKNELGIVK